MTELHYLTLAFVGGITLAVCLWQFHMRSLTDNPREKRLRSLKPLDDEWMPRNVIHKERPR